MTNRVLGNIPMGLSMTFLRDAAIGLTMFSAALCCGQALAQQNNVTDTQTKGSWSVRCYRSGPITCDMTQVDVDRQRNALIASVAFSLNSKTNSYLARFLLPLGVSFEQGLGLEIGSYKVSNLKYRVCGREGCWVMNLLSPQVMDAMQSGGSARGAMTATMIDGRKIQIPILMDGFSDSFETMKKLTEEKLASGDKSGKK